MTDVNLINFNHPDDKFNHDSLISLIRNREESIDKKKLNRIGDHITRKLTNNILRYENNYKENSGPFGILNPKNRKLRSEINNKVLSDHNKLYEEMKKARIKDGNSIFNKGHPLNQPLHLYGKYTKN